MSSSRPSRAACWRILLPPHGRRYRRWRCGWAWHLPPGAAVLTTQYDQWNQLVHRHSVARGENQRARSAASRQCPRVGSWWRAFRVSPHRPPHATPGEGGAIALAHGVIRVCPQPLPSRAQAGMAWLNVSAAILPRSTVSGQLPVSSGHRAGRQQTPPLVDDPRLMQMHRPWSGGPISASEVVTVTGYPSCQGREGFGWINSLHRSLASKRKLVNIPGGWPMTHLRGPLRAQQGPDIVTAFVPETRPGPLAFCLPHRN